MSDTLKDLYDKKEFLQGLLLHPGWKILMEEAAVQRELVLSTYEQPVAGLDESFAQEFAKGRAYQLKMLSQVPQGLIDNLTTDIQSLLTQENSNARSFDADPLDRDGSLDRSDPNRAP